MEKDAGLLGSAFVKSSDESAPVVATRLTPLQLVWVISVIRTHSEHNGDYCDTGADMDWACRSECVAMAIDRLRKAHL